MSGVFGNAVVAQGGGPTAVINQSLAGVILEARKHACIKNVYGALHGVSGIVNENFLDLGQMSTRNIETVAATPSSALKSTRDKPDAAYCERIFTALKAHDIRYFYYIGGNDSADTCRIVSETAQSVGYDLQVVHVPKTIDNDLLVTDHCPGFGSAARFVASAFAGANLDNRSLNGIYIGVVMGRNAGFLTAAAALGSCYNDDYPFLVYLPETAFDADKFCADVDAMYKKYGRCMIAVSEGITNAAGVPVISAISGNDERDSHGNVQLSGTGELGDAMGKLIKNKLGIKRVRSDTFGYLQRCYLGTVSPVDAAEAREAGEKAVLFSTSNTASGSVALKRTGDYSIEYFLTPLATVARSTRHMPPEFIDAKNAGVTQAFREYIRPLVGELPHYGRIDAPAVAKRLG